MSTMTKNEARQRRKIRIRKKISGTAERPRLVIFRSNLHMYAQVVDDLTRRHACRHLHPGSLQGRGKGQLQQGWALKR